MASNEQILSLVIAARALRDALNILPPSLRKRLSGKESALLDALRDFPEREYRRPRRLPKPAA
jgi:hypothetical protein